MRQGLLGLGLTIATTVFVVSACAPSQAQTQTYTGRVERVWEDGFRLDTGDRTLTVDSWDLYGDNTPDQIEVGDRLTVTGEFDDGEFDALSVTLFAPTEATAATPDPAPVTAPVQQLQSPTTYTGRVERVWEDGFRLDTGDRTLTVDSWDLYGDNTPAQIEVGDRLTVTGEFDDGEFDALSVTPAAESN